MARDCTSGLPGGGPGGFSNGPRASGSNGTPQGGGGRGEFDSEYASLMAELGENPNPGGGGGPSTPGGIGMGNSTPHERSRTDSQNQPQVQIGPDGKKIPPWRDPNVWNNHGGMGGGRGRGGMAMGMRGGFRGGMEGGYGRGGHHGPPGGFGG